MDTDVRQRLERSLIDERAALVGQIIDMGFDPATGAPTEDAFDHNFADSGHATAEKARLLAIADGLIETLREVDAALERMRAGTFGVCGSCAADIGLERLQARPYALLCITCKQRG